jgi:hypothetical protein
MLKSLLLASALTMAFSGSAMAGNVNGSVVADNHSLVVRDMNGIKTIIPNSAGSWPSAKTFNFNIDELNAEQMQQCKVHIIAWGDGSAAQGIAAHFSGAMSASTGSGPFVIGTVPNSVTGGQFPANGAATTLAQATSVLNALGGQLPAGWNSLAVGVGGITGTWGPVVMPALGPNPAAYPANFTFIWESPTLSANPKSYRVATLPCDKLQEPVKVVDVPGEHYQCYRIAKAPMLKPENIVVADQFGKAEIVLGQPFLLCNPSIKVHNGKNYAILNKRVHQVCYNIVKQSDQQPMRRVRTANQFTTADMLIGPRQMFCVPSYKTLLDGKEFPLD